MKPFLWTMVILFSISAVGKVFWLTWDSLPPRKPFEEAFDVVLAVVVIVWAAVLLARS